MIEFKVNEHITLKLEGGITNIYVAGELFRQCKFLLLNIPIKNFGSFDEMESIDEATEKYSKKMERRGWSEKINIDISPDIKFWGHCSNLQVWYENKYDTRILHRNLAFPLLKRLTEAGDLLAKKVFIEEIAKRVECGYWPVIEYLIEERYIDFLSPKEFFEIILEDDTEVNLLLKIEKANEIKLYLEKELSGEYNNFRVKNKHVVGLCLDSLDIEDILHSIGSFKSLQELHIISCKLKIIPDSIGMLEELEILHLIGNQIEELPDSMKTLTSLIRLDLSENVVNKIPDMISEFTSLKTLVMNKNKVEKISPSILKLEKLKNVLLNKNPLEKNLDILKKLEKKGIKIVV